MCAPDARPAHARHGAGALLSRNHGEYLAPKGRTLLKAGDIVTVRTPGGGGFGAPKARDKAMLEEDVRQGYVSQAAAVKAYAKARKRMVREVEKLFQVSATFFG